MMEEHFNLKTTKVLRTKEGTLFEIVTVLTLVASFGLAIAYHYFSTYENFVSFFVLAAVALGLLVGAYEPKSINMTGVQIKNVRQVALVVRFARIVALCLSLLLLLMAVVGDSSVVKPMAVSMVVVVGILGFVFIYLIQKAE